MRTTTLVLTLLLSTVMAPDAFAQQPYNVLEGTWKMVSQRQVYPDTVIVRTEVPPSVKILNSTHFAWGYQTDDGQDVLAGGGRYTLQGDTLYTEYIEYHTSPPLVGMAIQFQCRVEDDLWYHTGQIGDFRLEEVWQRVREDEAPVRAGSQ